MNGWFHGKRPILIGAVTAAALFGLHGAMPSVLAMSQLTYDKLKVLSEVYAQVKQSYVEEVDDQKLLYGAVDGMLRSLDPHSSFLTPDHYKEMKVETSGKFGGLGIEIVRGEGGIKVMSPIEDTPAYKAGVKPGDLIIKIDRETTQDMGLHDAVLKMRGKPGSQVDLTVVRDKRPTPLVFRLTRAIINVRSVKWRMEPNRIGYVRLIQFNEQTHGLLTKALEELKQEAGSDGLKGLVLDLRNNPGGLLDQAASVSDDFLNEGLIVYTKGRGPGRFMSFEAQEGELAAGVPMVALINSGSASASEIVAGALQDHKRAVILGTQSFGKGSVQTIIPMSDGSGLRLTTAQYYTPNGRSIQAKGIVPDLVLEDPNGKKKNAKRTTEADLKGHLKNAGEPSQANTAPPAASEPQEQDENAPPFNGPLDPDDGDGDSTDIPPEKMDRITGRAKEDVQLQRALELLTGPNPPIPGQGLLQQEAAAPSPTNGGATNGANP
ncbi:MAG: S41 family peptidase [Magnetococcales bacterium]|nr:S41 family peptidase [Magnetococcales bacterium]